ncbi:MAG: 2,4-dienoyl-CoA reductase-like NADH-dependent reductase (Old Yellow Enzyme family) [Candidatus Latescibacterota bacterium]|jgi:2,4-dienoyl-CoA reductase-like NADH-dependent reductase (Old Yellow Enzyme family)
MLDALFEPYQAAGLEFANRWVMAPMTRKRSPGGMPTEVAAEYYRRRAAGGVGLIVTEGTLVEHALASPDDDIPRIGEEQVAAWQTVVQAAQKEGAKIFVQLWHQGPMARPGIGAEAVVEEGREVVVKADAKEEKALFDAFVNAALFAQKAGFDGIELHGAHGYLLDSFLRYGRGEYVCDLVGEMRKKLGADYPIALRFSQWRVDGYEGQQFHSVAELESALLPLQKAGVDIFHASTRRFWLPEYDGSDMSLAGWTRKITGAPTITVGNVGLVTEELCGEGQESASELLRRYERGDFDMVAVGRPLLSDAAWCDKIRAGRSSEIVDYTPEANQVYP